MASASQSIDPGSNPVCAVVFSLACDVAFTDQCQHALHHVVGFRRFRGVGTATVFTSYGVGLPRSITV